MSGRCRDCRFWSQDTTDSDDVRGSCSSGKVQGWDNISYPYTPPDGAVGGGCEGYGDYLHTGPDFGCVHWQAKDPLAHGSPPWPTEGEILAAFENPELAHTDEHGGRYVVVGEIMRFRVKEGA